MILAAKLPGEPLVLRPWHWPGRFSVGAPAILLAILLGAGPGRAPALMGAEDQEEAAEEEKAAPPPSAEPPKGEKAKAEKTKAEKAKAAVKKPASPEPRPAAKAEPSPAPAIPASAPATVPAMAPATAPATAPASGEVARAIRDARKELAAVVSQADRESKESGARISEETQAILSMREEERKALEKLRELDGEARASEGKLAAVEGEIRRLDGDLSAAGREIRSQATALRSRLRGCLAAAEDARLLEALGEALKEPSPASARQGALLEAYEKVLLAARTVSIFPLPLGVEGEDGKVEKMNVLRFGLLGGYFHRTNLPNDGGLVLADPVTRTGFRATAQGLSAARKGKIAALFLKSEKGGELPIDVSGGPGVAVLEASAGGPRPWWGLEARLLWPLLAIAILAALLVVERTVVLVLSVRRLRSGLAKILALARSGKLDVAESACSHLSGSAGGVLGAALSTRDQGKEAIEAAVREAHLARAPLFRARLGFISLAAALALLVGLLGTVGGLFAAFRSVELAGGSEPRILMAGIAAACASLELGLAIAIPCVFFRWILGAVADRAIERLEAGGASMVALLLRREAPFALEEKA